MVYMQQIEAAMRAAGITVPFVGNEKGMHYQSWSSDYQDVGGAVDIYGLDSYPGGMSCTRRDAGFRVVRTYAPWFARYAGSQPVSLPEFEGGWFSGWGSGSFYDVCEAEHSPEFADVYYKVLSSRPRFPALECRILTTRTTSASAQPFKISTWPMAAPTGDTVRVFSSPRFHRHPASANKQPLLPSSTQAMTIGRLPHVSLLTPT